MHKNIFAGTTDTFFSFNNCKIDGVPIASGCFSAQEANKLISEKLASKDSLPQTLPSGIVQQYTVTNCTFTAIKGPELKGSSKIPTNFDFQSCNFNGYTGSDQLPKTTQVKGYSHTTGKKVFVSNDDYTIIFSQGCKINGHLIPDQILTIDEANELINCIILTDSVPSCNKPLDHKALPPLDPKVLIVNDSHFNFTGGKMDGPFIFDHCTFQISQVYALGVTPPT